MAQFDEAKVINALHPEKAEVGKKYWFADNIVWLKRKVENNESISILKDFSNPFFKMMTTESLTDNYYLLYPYEEPPKQQMTNRQLAEWLAKGNGQWKWRRSSDSWFNISYSEQKDNREVGENIVIRPWGSEEWVEPTVDIYERDCKGGK